MWRAATLALAFAGTAQAQGLTLSDLSAAVDVDASEIAGFRAALADPDPNRALAAMRILMASGEPLLVNLALEAGLSAPDGVMRKSAFEAYVATRPTLLAHAEIDGDFGEKFRSWIELSGGSVASETTGTLTLAIGPWDEDQRCYLRAAQDTCQTRVADGQLSDVMSYGIIGLVLGEGGTLTGSVSHERSGGPVSIRVPLLGQLQ
jgi:hypothetical protein